MFSIFLIEGKEAAQWSWTGVKIGVKESKRPEIAAAVWAN